MAVLLASSAQAQDTTFTSKFLTAGNWTISAIARNEGDGRMFCSAKASFGTALSFVFARESGGAQSLAFEFPGKPFSAGAMVPVLLAVGEMQYSLNALAATNRILLLGIARNSETEQAMLQNKPMQLQFAQQQYRMSLAGFAASARQVDACLAALARGETFPPARVEADDKREKFQTITPVVKRETSRIRNVTPEEIESFNPATAAQNAVLLDEIRRLRKENQKLLIEKQAAESQLLASPLDVVEGNVETRISVPQGTVSDNVVMPVIEPSITRADKDIMWPTSKSFSDMVATYMTTEASRCPADFAQTPGAEFKQANSLPVQEFEIACLGIQKHAGEKLPGDYAGALLFVAGKGKIDVIVHQGPAGMIEQALQARATVRQEMGIQK